MEANSVHPSRGEAYFNQLNSKCLRETQLMELKSQLILNIET